MTPMSGCGKAASAAASGKAKVQSKPTKEKMLNFLAGRRFAVSASSKGGASSSSGDASRPAESVAKKAKVGNARAAREAAELGPFVPYSDDEWDAWLRMLKDGWYWIHSRMGKCGSVEYISCQVGDCQRAEPRVIYRYRTAGGNCSASSV
eukprot:tig00001301_g8080.t1